MDQRIVCPFTDNNVVSKISGTCLSEDIGISFLDIQLLILEYIIKNRAC